MASESPCMGFNVLLDANARAADGAGAPALDGRGDSGGADGEREANGTRQRNATAELGMRDADPGDGGAGLSWRRSRAA